MYEELPSVICLVEPLETVRLFHWSLEVIEIQMDLFTYAAEIFLRICHRLNSGMDQEFTEQPCCLLFPILLIDLKMIRSLTFASTSFVIIKSGTILVIQNRLSQYKLYNILHFYLFVCYPLYIHMYAHINYKV